MDNANQPILCLHWWHCKGTTNGTTAKVISCGNNWTSHAVFKLRDKQDFEVKMTMHNSCSNIMLGFAPSNIDMNTANLKKSDGYFLQLHGPEQQGLLIDRGATNKSFGPFFQKGNSVQMKLSEGLHGSMVLQYATEGGKYGTAAFDSIPCDTYCPVVCFSGPDQSITMESISGGATVVKYTVKQEIMFLVTNRMEMLQSSSTLAIELIAKTMGTA